MKFSEQWLREWVDPPLDTGGLAEKLSLSGLEVAAVEAVAVALDKVVVGEIVSIASHPQADRLRVCQVDAGKGKTAQVVCGAPNAARGMKAPLALPGARLPGGQVIEEATLRGVPSAGMLCSAVELGLGESAAGLMALDAGAVPGTPIAEALGLADHAIEIELTPNRGDCLSIGGVAREVSALTGVRVRAPRIEPVPARTQSTRPVTLENPAGCPRYVGRVIEDIDPQASTPLWMQERLRRCGQRSIAPVVDITNYVMLELGQPMHAFDLERLHGPVRVRDSRAGEALTLLDDSESHPPPGTLLIADDRGPVALAGIMGGRDSSVTGATRHLFLESAYFDPGTIGTRARALGMQTEAAYRFERGVDPALQRLAVERATALLLAIVGGRPGPVIEAAERSRLPARRPALLRHDRLQKVIGAPVSAREAQTILRRLGMRLQAAGRGAWRVTPPSHRFDIEREADLIEEVARVYGYGRIPAVLPVMAMAAAAPPEEHLPPERFRDLLVDRGYQEVITYSFVDDAAEKRLDPRAEPLALSNPLSAELGVMRTSLWPGLLQTVARNLNRQHRRVRVFETGRVFRTGKGGGLAQVPMIGGAVSGDALPQQWGEEAREADVFDLKADVEALLGLGGATRPWGMEPLEDPALQPGQAMAVTLDGARVGRLGRLHPAVQRGLDLEQPALLFELELEKLQNRSIPRFSAVSRQPAIRRDLSLSVEEGVAAGAVDEIIRRTAGEVLTKLELFDVYRGKGIDSRRKSLTFALTLQHSSRTLRDTEVDGILARVLSALRLELGAELRN